MSESTVESDPLFQLLSEALRAGPGSETWEQAVAQIRNGQGGAVDEYQLILNAREALENGRDYRAVRAGPAFTRRLMDGLDNAPGPRRISVAGVVGLISVVAIVIVLGIVGYSMFGGNSPGDDAAITKLEQMPLTRSFATATFTGSAVTPGWRQIGEIPLVANLGLRPAANTASADSQPIGGGIVTTAPLSADHAFQVRVEYAAAKSSDVTLQVFVTDQNEFDARRGTATREIAWLLQNGEQTAQVNGKGQERLASAERGEVRIRVGEEHAIITVNNQKLWAGRHGLAKDKPRFVGVRFLRPNASAPLTSDKTPSVESLNVMTGAPQTTP